MSRTELIKVELSQIHEDLGRRVTEIMRLLMVISSGQSEMQKIHEEAVKMRGGEVQKIDVLRVSLQMSCVYTVVLFEEMIRDYVSLYYHERPESLNVLGDKSHKSVSYEKILSKENIYEVIEEMIEKALFKFTKNLDEVEKKYFDGLFEHRLSEEFDKWKVIRRIYYLRNLIVHEHSIMSEDVFGKIGGETEPGDKIQIQPRDITFACQALHNLNDHIRNVVADKLELERIE